VDPIEPVGFILELCRKWVSLMLLSKEGQRSTLSSPPPMLTCEVNIGLCVDQVADGGISPHSSDKYDVNGGEAFAVINRQPHLEAVAAPKKKSSSMDHVYHSFWCSYAKSFLFFFCDKST